MQIQLTCHPDHPPGPVEAVFVDVQLQTLSPLTLWYVVVGQIDALVVPPSAPERRADGLWETTCFEAFFRQNDDPDYLEFNFSPSSEWAAYAFSGYRQGIVPAALDVPPIISTAYPFETLEVHVTLSLPSSGPHAIGLSAIIEEKNGSKSYWALAHPPGKPDFHHPDCFALHIPAPDAA